MAGWNDNRGERARDAGLARTAVVLASLLAVALLCGCAGSSPSGQAGSSGGGRQAADAAERLGTPALGGEDAPVVLTEYSDYQ